MHLQADSGRLMLHDGELRLRPARLPEDINPALAWYEDPEVMLLSEGDAAASYDADMIAKMYCCLAERGELYIIELLADGEWHPIGDATLAPTTLPITIGAAAYRSKGYGKRVLQLLVDRARSLG